MKISQIKIRNNCLVVLNGKQYHSNDFTDNDQKMLNEYIRHYNMGCFDDDVFETKVKMLFTPAFGDDAKKNQYTFLSSRDYNKPSILTKRNASYYMMSVSELSLPLDLVEKIYRAEDEGRNDLVETYKNFWTLVSLNPDSRVRNDLFAFITVWNIKIARSGLLVMYRNADIRSDGSTYSTQDIDFIATSYDHVKHVSKKSPRNYYVAKDDKGDMFLTKSEYDNGVIGNLDDLYHVIINNKLDKSATPTYTDHYSHKFEIKLGEIVSMPRENCCADQTQSCAPSLHAASKEWLKQNYFGNVGMKVLVNPADVVATPITPDRQFQEGKLRTCAYYPFSIIEYGDDGLTIDDVDDGVDYASEADFINKIAYTGIVNNDDIDHYSLPIPKCVEINKETVYENLLDLANSFSHNI